MLHQSARQQLGCMVEEHLVEWVNMVGEEVNLVEPVETDPSTHEVGGVCWNCVDVICGCGHYLKKKTKVHI